jgi:DNA-binding response OmpR family regulator
VDLILCADQSDEAVARLVSWARGAGHTVTEARSAVEARHLAGSNALDCLLFDPAVAGDAFAAEQRPRLPAVAFLAWLPVYSSRRAAELLEQGSDDVLHGALPQREALARIEAAGRRAGRSPLPATVSLGDLHVDAAQGETTWRGEPFRLTRREREVLQVLADAGGLAVRREDIYRLVWGYAMARGDRTVDVNVRRLRAKLRAVAGEDVTVATQPGIGYRLELAQRNEAVTNL